MANPPGGKDDLESRKTRFVPRNDIVEPDAGKAAGGSDRLAQTGPMDGAPAAAPAGTVIGRTRLVSPGAQSDMPSMMPAPPLEPSSAPKPAAAAGAGAKTEFIRNDRAPVEPVVGWVVVVQGPGRGSFKPVYVGMNSLGRDASQRVCLDFGDETISRQEHAFITYDDELRRYWVQNGGKANIVRLGNEALTTPHELKGNDMIRIGKTVLRFYPVCSADFSWTDEAGDA